jgi:uncharacterized protein YjiS (DUF1127 family)
LGARRKAASAVRLSLLHLLGLWLERARSRRQLRLLLTDPHVLADLGLTPEQADLEAIKPFWR